MTLQLKKISVFCAAICFMICTYATGNGGKGSPDTLKTAKTPEKVEATSGMAEMDFSFGKAITNDSIDLSLLQLSNRKQSAFWNTAEINMYGQDMSEFADTVSYVLHDPGKGIEFVRPVSGKMTSGFGPRRLYGRHYHYGVDLDLDTGDTVAAAMDGVVRIARYGGGYGKFVIICHKDGLETLYGHMSELLVTEGQEIKHGEAVGLGGSTGQSTGSHLHLEFRIFGEQIDPARIIDFMSPLPKKVAVTVDGSWFDHLNGYKKPRYHIVKPGDSIARIATLHKVDASQICELNELELNTELEDGLIIRYQ